ncbi:MAG: endolytic transglycosylase MltG [Sandaracinaceae bacterium]|nr:endolytic transglycosylase MltG [Sandaracinaceae bacterium]
MSPRDVLQRVAAGFGEATVRVTVPEGFDRYDIAARLERWGVAERSDFLRASEDRALLDELGIEGPSAEGYLFPDTYRLPQDAGGEEAVRRLVANWERRAAPLYEEHAGGLESLSRELSWGRHQALILASIIEREAVVSEERPVIARVFVNRLVAPGFSPRRLQADPTVSYGCRAAASPAPSCAAWDGRSITRAMLADRANPYNTYRHEGSRPVRSATRARRRSARCSPPSRTTTSTSWHAAAGGTPSARRWRSTTPPWRACASAKASAERVSKNR